MFFFFNDTATTEIYTLSLHDALPILISSKVAAQLPLLIVHLKVAALPAVIPVMVVVGLVLFVIVAVPLWTLQAPVPTTAVFAAIGNVLVLHWFRLTPASATVGLALFVNTTSSVLGVHTPLLIVQRNVTLLPAVSPVTVLVFEPAAVMLAPFAAPTIVQAPLPAAGMFPASVKFPPLHCSCSAPGLRLQLRSWGSGSSLV